MPRRYPSLALFKRLYCSPSPSFQGNRLASSHTGSVVDVMRQSREMFAHQGRKYTEFCLQLFSSVKFDPSILMRQEIFAGSLVRQCCDYSKNSEERNSQAPLFFASVLRALIAMVDYNDIDYLDCDDERFLLRIQAALQVHAAMIDCKQLLNNGYDSNCVAKISKKNWDDTSTPTSLFMKEFPDERRRSDFSSFRVIQGSSRRVLFSINGMTNEEAAKAQLLIMNDFFPYQNTWLQNLFPIGPAGEMIVGGELRSGTVKNPMFPL